MNKLYSLLVAFAAVFSAMAQTTYVLTPAQGDEQTPVMQQSMTVAPSACLKAPAAYAKEYENFTLEDGQYIIGNSTDDEYAMYGRAPYNGDVLVGSVIYSSTYQKLTNCRALGIRFCLPEAVDVKCVTLHDSEIDPIKEQKLKKKAQPGWNYVAFDTPQQLDPKGTFISYTYVQTDENYGICNWDVLASGGFYVYLFNSDQGKWTWGNFSAYYGAVCIQLIVEADPLPDYDFVPTEVETFPAGQGQQGSLIAYFTSNSSKDIHNFDYTIKVGDKERTDVAELPYPIEAGIDRVVGYRFAFDAPEEYGEYPGSLTINSVNGEALNPAPSIEFKQPVYTRVAKRRTVVEELTGTGCGYCPRGWAGMEYLKRTYTDDFIGIAVHQYNEGDPMYFAKYAKPGFGGAPTCVIDRSSGATDPYFGSVGNNIGDDFEFYNAIAPSVDVEVSGVFTADLKKVNCSANVEFLTNTGKYTIAYVLTADGLRGKNATWLQTNYYATKDAAGAGVLAEIPELADFCIGGSNEKGSVLLTFNDVLIGSSYSSTGSNLAKALGTSTHTAGEKLDHAYTCTLNTAAELVKVLDYDNIYVNALIVGTDGKIANAARARVKTLEGLHTVLAENPDETAVSYDLSGRRVPASAHGISIVGGKKIIKQKMR